MRSTLIAVAFAGSMIVGTPHGTGPDSVPTDAQVGAGASRQMTEDDRRRLDGIIASVEKRPMRSLTIEARTIEEARKLAEIDKKDDWEAEYNGWFVFTSSTRDGRPFFWDVVLVKKGTNQVTGYREIW